MTAWLAERKLVAVRIETGERVDVTFRVGTPYWVPGDDFARCPLQLDGVYERIAGAPGVDLLQALQLASNLDALLSPLRSKYDLFWPTGETYFNDDLQDEDA